MGERGPEKLSVVVYDGHFDKVHYALVMASAAAAIGTPVTLFFTMEACRALVSTDGGPSGWAALPLSDGGGTGAERDAEYASRKVATFDELLEACAAMEVKFLVCEMGLRAKGLARADLRGDIAIEEGGVVTFLTDASKDGAVVFI
ncbi:MAG: DsrE family protein [Magnetovibrio sp.]|nr:DsrE family protein [Magnetovibrio sp.]